MLVGGATVVAGVSDQRLLEFRSAGPAMKRWGGTLLIGVGVWFGFLALANPIYLLP